VPPVGWLSTPWVQAFAIWWEVCLGCWLLSSAHPWASWFAAVATFSAFAAVSAYLAWIGHVTCGCLGIVKASPRQALIIDCVVLMSLLLARPRLRVASTAIGKYATIRVAVFLSGAALLFLGFTGLGTLIYGSPRAALARMRGEVLAVTPRYVDFGATSQGMHLRQWVEVHNWADRSIRLVGGTSDCSCVTTAGLPITILPGEARAIPIELKVPPSAPGSFTRVAELWTDVDTQRVIQLYIGCRIK